MAPLLVLFEGSLLLARLFGAARDDEDPEPAEPEPPGDTSH
jgi:hypothetical protein